MLLSTLLCSTVITYDSATAIDTQLKSGLQSADDLQSGDKTRPGLPQILKPSSLAFTLSILNHLCQVQVSPHVSTLNWSTPK